MTPKNKNDEIIMPSRTPAVERFSGFANLYDRYRPEPPEALGDLLCLYADCEVPNLVIDLGCGTGLSTRYWANRAHQVVGIDPTQDMLSQAKLQTAVKNINYLRGFGQRVGLKDGCADILTISQAFHWMEPEQTLAEIARLLRSGGVLAVYDHEDSPILPNWQAEEAYRNFWEKSHELDSVYQINPQVPRWAKSGHLQVIQSSGHFSFTREVHLHQVIMGNADLLIGFAKSYGYIQSLIKNGASEKEIGLTEFKDTVKRILGDELKPWYWTTRTLIGIR